MTRAASDLANIGSTINEANAAAAGQTTSLLAAGADEVSAAVAALFGAHAQSYQTVSAQVAAFHQQFVQAMNAGANAYEVVIETLRATTTSTGLTVNAVLDTTTYDRGIKITDKEIAALEATQLHRHEFHGDWNYTLTADPTATRQKTPT